VTVIGSLTMLPH